MRGIRTEVEIAAPVDRAWRVLCDFASYPEWNPYLVRVTGAPEVGARVALRVQSKPIPSRFDTLVLVADPRRELRWRGHVLGGLVAGEHYFQFVPLGDRTRFVHGEELSGPLSLVAWRIISRDIHRGHAAMNAAYKARVEANH